MHASLRGRLAFTLESAGLVGAWAAQLHRDGSWPKAKLPLFFAGCAGDKDQERRDVVKLVDSVQVPAEPIHSMNSTVDLAAPDDSCSDQVVDAVKRPFRERSSMQRWAASPNVSMFQTKTGRM
jgi:hypothetical protein